MLYCVEDLKNCIESDRIVSEMTLSSYVMKCMHDQSLQTNNLLLAEDMELLGLYYNTDMFPVPTFRPTFTSVFSKDTSILQTRDVEMCVCVRLVVLILEIFVTLRQKLGHADYFNSV